jgi:hypothetical protein
MALTKNDDDAHSALGHCGDSGLLRGITKRCGNRGQAVYPRG